ncbi:MAG: response regulator [Proteobacteria bacterium]|nr:response regulator [Burkholderiales bacterium]
MVKVLIVEDEHSQAEVLTMLLRLEGFDVAVAVNGHDALTQLDDVRPDLIVTDYMMPEMNGGEMARQIRARPLHGRIPIIMTSATDARQVEQHGAYYDAFLRKPYLWDDLFVIIKRLLPSSRQQ